MYGWLTAPRAGRHALAQAECGLCAHYGARFRTRTRLLAATDPTLLVMLLEGLVDDPPERVAVRCPLTFKLTRRRAVDPSWAPLESVAALQLVLASEKLIDDRLDKEGLVPRLGAALLARDVANAEARLLERAFPLAELRAHLRAQSALEADPGADLDALATPTARGLGLIAGWLATQLGAPAATAARFGETLGRLLYLVDALHDLVRDRARGRFNPLDAALGPLSPRRLAFLGAHLDGLARAHAQAFAALPLRRHREALAASLVEDLADSAREALGRLDGATLQPLPASPR